MKQITSTLAFLCLAGQLLAVENVALRATVTASAQRNDQLAARYVNDGTIPVPDSKDDNFQAWAASTNLADTATLTFSWPEPTPVATIVYYGRTAWGLEMCWKDYEIYLDDQPAPVARGTFERAHGPQAVRLPATVRARKLTLKLLTHYSSKGAPGASEVQILDGPPPASALLGVFSATELEIRYAYFPSHDLVRFLVPQPPAGATAWQVALWPELGDAPLAQRSGALPMSAAGENLAVPKLPVGSFRLRFTFTGGATPVFEDRAFLRRTFEWEGQKLGLEDVIIPPFEPLTVTNQTVGSVLRQHTHGAGGLWRQVVSRGHELLAAPVRLEVGGKTVAGESPAFKTVKPTQVTGTAAWKGGTTEFSYDYDGLMQVKLRLLPGNIERLQLVIPFKVSEAWLMHPVTQELRQHYAGRIPSGEGTVWDSSKVPSRVAGRFVPYIYIGGPERGICFAADNDRDWINDPEIPAMEIDRAGDTVNLRLNLIAKPATLTRERTITFALQATPAKPMPEAPLNWRRWWATRTANDIEDVQLSFFGGNQYWGGRYFAVSLYPALEDYGFWNQLAKHRQTGKVEAGYLESFLAKFDGASAEELANLRAHYNEGLRLASLAPVNTADTKKFTVVVPYTNPRGLSRENRAFATTYLDEWQRADIADPRWEKADRVTRQSKKTSVWYDIEPVPSFVDMILFYHKKMVETFADGIYWDNFFLKPSFIPAEAGGPGYIDDEGKLQPGVNLMGFRNLAKRNAVMMHVMGKRPLSYIHMTNVNIVPMLAFGTMNLDWEWRDQGDMATKDLQTRLGADRDTDLILAQSLGLQAGNISVGISRFEPPKGSPITREWLYRTVMAVCFPHEIKIDKGSREVTFVQQELARFGYGQPDCKVYRYWEKGFPLEAEGANMRALVLARDGKVLIALGNYGASATGEKQAPASSADGPSLEAYDAGQRGLKKTNIALAATVKASSQHSAPYDARYVADSKVPAPLSEDDAGLVWAAGKNTDQASLTFTWEAPVPVDTLVYYGRTAWSLDLCWKDYEIYIDDQAQPAVKGAFERKHGPQPVSLPRPVKARQVTLKFLSHYGGKGSPGAAEVQIFSQKPAPVDYLGDCATTKRESSKDEHRVYTVRLKLDLEALGLTKAARAHDVELKAGITKTEYLKPVQAPVPPAGRGKKNGKPDPDADVIKEDLSPLKCIAPGVFELSIATHDFALIRVE